MRIGIDARAAVKITDGIGRYVIELIKAYSRRDDDNQYIVFKNPELEYSFNFDKRFEEVVTPIKKFTIYEQIILPRLLASYNLDIFHSLHFTLPLFYKGVKILTVHDIMPILMPWFFGGNRIMNKLASTYFNLLVKNSISRAKFIITDSDHTKNDIIKHFKKVPDLINRIYLGINHADLESNNIINSIRDKFNLFDPYIVTITNFRPYKNTNRLIEAFNIVSKVIPELSIVIVGGNQRYFNRTIGKNLKVDNEKIKLLGYLDDASLKGLIKNADVFVFPSLYEGFGFPILESMMLGTPVITSKAASIPEIGGDSVYYVDPYDINDIARGIINIYTNKELRNKYSKKGLVQAKKFHWNDTAEKTLEIYKKAKLSESLLER